MTTKRPDRLADVMEEIEALAKRLRNQLRRAARKSGLTKNLERAAVVLRKQGALFAAQIERFAHAIRTELARDAALRRPVSRRRRAA